MKPARLSDAELLEGLEHAANRIAMTGAEDLRHVGDVLAGLALEAGARIRARGRDALRDRIALLEDRASRLEDAAFHFQTCSVCKRQGEDFCSVGQRFAAYLRGEEGALEAPPAGPMIGKIRNVTLHRDGRLTGVLEVEGAGPKFLEQIRRADDGA